jgi:UDP-GlcNAc:undecaprenyl-phosphate/decaprenyl-phosphate GlcNAc-1-phosphate transferase
MLFYIITSLLLLVAIKLYFKIADRFNIIDKPNERSSHSYVTILGGGVVFVVAAFIWFFSGGLMYPQVFVGLLMIATISFIDDLTPLSGKLRMAVQFAAVLLMFYATGLFNLHFMLIAIALIACIYWINAFNFMDGINAITPFYAATALITFLYLNSQQAFINNDLIIVLIIAAAIFSFYNARPRALTFAGDVGSVSLAYLLAWMMIALVINSGRPEYLLLFAVYFIDSVFTILHRLKLRQNIFKAHRFHLYQLLSNEVGIPHVAVASAYAAEQLILNVLVIYLIQKSLLTFPVLLLIIGFYSTTYLLARFMVLHKIGRTH